MTSIHSYHNGQWDQAKYGGWSADFILSTGVRAVNIAMHSQTRQINDLVISINTLWDFFQ